MMKTYTAKTLILTLLTLWLGVFNVSTGYALSYSEKQKLLASDGTFTDLLGFSLSISGDTAVIGAYDDDNGNNSGAAYVFVRDVTGVWREQQKLIASDGAKGDFFGFSVSISADTAVIGARGDDDKGSSSGSVYIFARDGAGIWHEQQKLTASDGTGGDNFGWSVSLFPNTAVIGASTDDNNNGLRSGSVYIFESDGAGVWHEQQKLTASDGTQNNSFGFSVSLFGNTVVIGGQNIQSVYVFVRDGVGMWHEQQILKSSDATAGSAFGFTVSLFANTVVIGAPGDDDGTNSGSAYVFARDGAGIWSEQQRLTASDRDELDAFGYSVSISGDTIVIGAKRDDDKGSDSGSAYVFVRDDVGVWREKQKLIASDGAAEDVFGTTVSIAGNTAVIGAPEDDDNGNRSGSVYVYETNDSNSDLLTFEKRINYRVRETAGQAAQLLVGTRYRADYKVTNNSANRIYRVQVFEDGQLICNLYSLEPGASKRSRRCARNEAVLSGIKNVPAIVTAKVSGSRDTLSAQTDAYYTGLSNVSGQLNVTHYINEKNADTQASAVELNDNEAVVKFRIENTGPIEIYRVKLYHDPASPVNSGWQELCYKGTLMPGEVRYCKRTIRVTQSGLNKAFGRVQSLNANLSPMGFVNASNPTYFNVVLP